MTIAQYYFDWKGPRDTVKEYGEKLVKACEKTGTKFHGIYGPGQDKWNFVAVIEAENMLECMKPFQKAGGMPENMPHFIVKFFNKVYP